MAVVGVAVAVLFRLRPNSEIVTSITSAHAVAQVGVERRQRLTEVAEQIGKAAFRDAPAQIRPRRTVKPKEIRRETRELIKRPTKP